MDVKGKCGLCSATDYKNHEERQASIDTRVSMNDKQETNAAWVECSTRTCRAQYVVYHTEGLNVRPKCHYCRLQSSKPDSKRSNDPAPWLECEQCLSRVIFPQEYRHTISTPFKCAACSYGHKTVVDIETTASSLSKENSTAWLLLNKKQKLKEPFGGASLFKHITQAGAEGFCEEVILFPDVERQKLFLNGKVIQNTPDVIAQLKSWVSGRRTESGTCSLCFSTLRKTDLNPACGRRGCGQSVCRDCLRGWYGLNAAGKIINTAALSCPFCRRTPTAKTLHGYGMGIHAVGDLQDAVKNSGEWVYAWCVDCARAKKYLERVCAAGAPAELNAWVCEGCEQIREETAEREVAELEAEIARIEAENRRLGYEERMIAQTIQRARMSIKTQQRKRLITKECPKCKAMTERSSGCGHMTCICGTHWCWYCGYKSRSGYADDIYSHMAEKHGGWFVNEEEYEGLELAGADGMVDEAPYGVHIFINE
jgi:glutaredoxin